MGCCFAANQYLVSNIALFFNATETQMGFMVSAIYIGSMVMVLFFGEFAERVGKRIAAATTSAVLCIGATIIALAPSVYFAILGFALFGAGFGGFESSIIALISDKNPVNTNRVLNLRHALFSTGAVLSPLMLAAFLPDDRFRSAYIIVFAGFAAIFVYFFLNKAIDDFAIKTESSGGLTIFRLVKNPLLLSYMIAMILFVGTETTITFWISTYFDGQGFAGFGAAALSGYWLASIAGRLIGSRFQSAASLTVPCFLLAAISAILLLIVPGAIPKVCTIILFGLAYGPLYGGLQLLGASLFPENSAAAFSLMIFAGGLGGTFFQPVISRFMSSGDTGRVYILVSIICVAVAVLMFFTNRKAAAIAKE